MTNFKKGFAVPLFLAIITVLAIGGGAYVYLQKQQMSRPVAIDPNVQTMPIQAMPVSQDITNTNKQLPVAANILPYTYSNLTDYEKTLVVRMKKSSIGEDNGVTLKYYDVKSVAFIIAPPKGGGASLSIFDIETLKLISTRDFPLFGNYLEGNSYIVAATEKDFVFYKKGAVDFQTVSNSVLPVSETYVKGVGDMGSYIYDFIFDEPTKTLTASVFKLVNGSALNTKLRTVKFVLP